MVGLKPDHNEAGNSWPLGLDLSRTKHIRSLKGLQFNDIEGKNAEQENLNDLNFIQKVSTLILMLMTWMMVNLTQLWLVKSAQIL
ncbi:hypothetical protein [Mycoplasmopsis cynos]|uniref:hypothetical protein n=1 Tax=Mycoplasmopsis cynos TaxID=171284 RepID=UPI0024C7455D|nr:hypothetical protein [Mycoplasmopsis cynos]WAM07654.1 hypothetical protein ONA21_06035 [Mycoplasmopsis cynos]